MAILYPAFTPVAFDLLTNPEIDCYKRIVVLSESKYQQICFGSDSWRILDRVHAQNIPGTYSSAQVRCVSWLSS